MWFGTNKRNIYKSKIVRKSKKTVMGSLPGVTEHKSTVASKDWSKTLSGSGLARSSDEDEGH